MEHKIQRAIVAVDAAWLSRATKIWICMQQSSLMFDVDRQTGVVRVPTAVIAVDVGKIINPDGVINRIERGMMQAISLIDEGADHVRSASDHLPRLGDRRSSTSRTDCSAPFLSDRIEPALKKSA